MLVIASIVKSINDRYRVINIDTREDYTGIISDRVVEKAYNSGKLIQFDTDSKKYQNSNFILASRIKYLDDDRPKEDVLDNATSFVINAVQNKPDWLVFSKTKWAIMARNIFRQVTTLVVGPTGNGKTTAAIEVAKSVGRPCFVFNLGSTQDPRSSLIGTMAYNKERGTYFEKSNFIKALETENSVIVLDEITRAHPEAFNIILPLLDFQKTIRIEENNEIINISKGVSFIATANIGIEYTSTRILDRALVDRLVRIDVGFLTKEQEISILNKNFPSLSEIQVNALSSLADIIRKDYQSDNPKVQTYISTRMLISTAGLVSDGFSLRASVIETIFPHFDDEGGVDSERTFVNQAFQKAYIYAKDDSEL
jgi:hypothetical protein